MIELKKLSDMKKYITTIAMICLILQINAQKKAFITYHTISKPKFPLEGVNTLYVEPFENIDPNSLNVQTSYYFKKAIIEEYRRNNIEAKGPLHSQYTHTDWYTIVDDPEKADAVVSGTYKPTLTSTRDVSDKIERTKVQYLLGSIYYEKHPDDESFKRPVPLEHQVPYIVRNYSYSNSVSMDITVKITRKDGKVLFEDTFSGNDQYSTGESTGRHSAIPGSKSLQAMEMAIVDKFVYNTFWKTIPMLGKHTVKLIDIKPDDRELKKQLVRKLNFKTTEELLRGTELSMQVYEKEKNKDAAYNASMMLIFLGYFNEAKEWLSKCEQSEKTKILGGYFDYRTNLLKDAGIPLKEKKLMFP